MVQWIEMVFNLMEVAGQIVLDGCPCQFLFFVLIKHDCWFLFIGT